SGSDPTSGGVSSGVDHYVYQLDSGTAVTTSSTSVSGLSVSEGNHTFKVYAVDAAGNSDDRKSVVYGRGDTTAPGSSITANHSDATNSTSADFSWSGSDPTSGGVSSGVDHYVYQLDSGTAVTTSSTSVSGLSVGEGSHTFKVYAVDAAGNS